MQLDQYQMEVAKTEPEIDSDLLARFSNVGRLLLLSLNRISAEIESLDALKKYIFLAKPLPDHLLKLCEHTPDLDEYDSGPEHALLRMMHGIIGSFTEVDEVMQEVLSALSGKEAVDWCNLEEELGDQLWYLAVMANACNVRVDKDSKEKNEGNLAKIAFVNTEKLRARYPGQFKSAGCSVIASSNEDQARLHVRPVNAKMRTDTDEECVYYLPSGVKGKVIQVHESPYEAPSCALVDDDGQLA